MIDHDAQKLGGAALNNSKRGATTNIGINLIAYLLALGIALSLATTGSGTWFDESMQNVRAELRTHPASGDLHVIEIDAKSISALSTWPWPRRFHAQLVDRLSAANVSTIAFDVDFSAPSNADDDLAFSTALKGFSGSVILPTFSQAESSQSKTRTENLPIAAFRKYAMMGSVNVRPDRDGLMRNYEFGTVTQNVPRPSIGALLANYRGRVGETFRIDTSIDPLTIPHHSFIDVLNGKIPSAALAGKSVIIGATAIELGDRYAISRHGVIPGVFVQAMAAETLMGGTQNPDYGYLPMLLLAALFGLLTWRLRRTSTQHYALAAGAVTIWFCPLAFEVSGIATFGIAPAFAGLASLSAMLTAIRIVHEFRLTKFYDQETGVPNERSLIKSARAMPEVQIIVIRLNQFEQLTAILTIEQRKQLITRVVDRLSVTTNQHRITMLSPGTLAITMTGGDINGTVNHVEGIGAIFRSPIELGGRSIIVKVAFGIAHGVGKDISQLIKYASFSAVRAEEEGHVWNLHNSRVTDEAERAQVLLADLDEALTNGDIYVAFQPKWSFAKSNVCGSEALVRWRHAALGPVGPDQFIPVLETNQRLDKLTLFVFDQSIAEVKRWRKHGADIGVAVNLSAPLLSDAEFSTALLNRIRDADVPAHLITLEVTESATIKSEQATIDTLTAVRLLGAKVSIDDYGTGQSTLSYLKTFPADEIKIDQSFVTRMMESQSDRILVRSTIELAHELGLKVVAEGVEDAACLATLKTLNCDTAQGWHIGKPIVADEFFAAFVASDPVPLTLAPRA